MSGSAPLPAEVRQCGPRTDPSIKLSDNPLGYPYTTSNLDCVLGSPLRIFVEMDFFINTCGCSKRNKQHLRDCARGETATAVRNESVRIARLSSRHRLAARTCAETEPRRRDAAPLTFLPAARGCAGLRLPLFPQSLAHAPLSRRPTSAVSRARMKADQCPML